jgi:serine O-acetyltransferase
MPLFWEETLLSVSGNVWLTHSVSPDTEVFIKKQDLIFGAKQYKKQAAKQKLR